MWELACSLLCCLFNSPKFWISGFPMALRAEDRMTGLGEKRALGGTVKFHSLQHSFLNTSLLHSLLPPASKEGSAGFLLSSSPNRWWMWTCPKVNYKWVTDVYIPSWMNDYMRIRDLLASGGMINSDHSLMQKEPQIKQVPITVPVSFMQLTWVE